MKNDRRYFKLPREPMEGDPQKYQRLRGSCTSGRLRDYRIPVTGYDDSGRQEEKRTMRLWLGPKKTYWYSRSGPQFSRPPTGFSKSDDGGLPGLQYRPESETTWPIEKENRHGYGRAFEQVILQHKKSLASQKNECSNLSCTHQSIALHNAVSVRSRTISRPSMTEEIQMARNKLLESDRSESINGMNRWLDIGETYLLFFEYDSTAAINSAGPGSSRRNEIWQPEFSRYPVPLRRRWRSDLPISLSARYLAEWDFVMVESVRLVLQRWRGVCSFSQTMRSTRSDEESHAVYDLRPQKQSRPGE